MNNILKSIVELIVKLFSKKNTNDNAVLSSSENNSDFNIYLIYSLFPYANRKNIDLNYTLLVKTLYKHNIFNRDLLIYCLATISVEVPKFDPVVEKPSKFSTKGGNKPYDFSGYSGRMGNKNLQDATKYKGRGLIQLTGYNNYKDMDSKLNLGGKLIENPDLALLPEISIEILVIYMKDRLNKIQPALDSKDFKTLRKVVNGGYHGLDSFIFKFKELDEVLPK